MPRPKGTPKTGGRKKGSPSKKSTIIGGFRSRLEANKVDIERELAKAIAVKDVDMIKALTALMPYLTPRMKESVPGRPEDPEPQPLPEPRPTPVPAPETPAKPNLTILSNDRLTELLKKKNGSNA